MEVDTSSRYVNFITEKDLKKSKVHKKRKRVGNRIPIGEKVAKKSAAHRTPNSRPQRPKRVEPEPEESSEEDVSEDIEQISEASSDAEEGKPSTFSGALESLLGRASTQDDEKKVDPGIMKDLPKKSEDEEAEAAKAAKKAREESRVAALQRKLFQNKDHKVPDFSGAELEAKLRKVATRGVVKLFNAIKTHQKLVAEPVGTTRSVTDEASKKKFMDSLKRDRSKKPSTDADDDFDTPLPPSKIKKGPGAAAPSWEVLRDDYMLGAKMKDWNKESDEE